MSNLFQNLCVLNKTGIKNQERHDTQLVDLFEFQGVQESYIIYK